MLTPENTITTVNHDMFSENNNAIQQLQYSQAEVSKRAKRSNTTISSTQEEVAVSWGLATEQPNEVASREAHEKC